MPKSEQRKLDKEKYITVGNINKLNMKFKKIQGDIPVDQTRFKKNNLLMLT
jgi:hypothetical protein